MIEIERRNTLLWLVIFTGADIALLVLERGRSQRMLRGDRESEEGGILDLMINEENEECVWHYLAGGRSDLGWKARGTYMIYVSLSDEAIVTTSTRLLTSIGALSSRHPLSSPCPSNEVPKNSTNHSHTAFVVHIVFSNNKYGLRFEERLILF